MSTFPLRQPVTTFPHNHNLINYDCTEATKYHMGYSVLNNNYNNNNVMTTTGCGDLSANFFYGGYSTSIFNSLPVNSPITHGYFDPANVRKAPDIALTRDQTSGVEPMSLDGISISIMAMPNSNHHDDTSEWRRRVSTSPLMTTSPVASPTPMVTVDSANNNNVPLLSPVSLPNNTMNSGSDLFPTASVGPSTGAVVVSTPQSSSSSAMECALTNHSYIFIQPDHHQQYNTHHQQYHQQQQNAQNTTIDGNYPHAPAPSRSPLLSHGLQEHPSSMFPSDSNSARPSVVAWTNGSVGGDTTMQMQQRRHSAAGSNDAIKVKSGDSSVQPLPNQKKSHSAQRSKQGKVQPLHIVTAGMGPVHSQSMSAGPMDTSAPHSMVAPPHQAAADHYTQNHYWSMAPSPVESCVTSGSSTPSFASMSPSLSYSLSDLNGTSSDSSRAVSPSATYTNHSEAHVTDRRFRRRGSEPTNSIVHCRKSSTSSTSSYPSHRRMSTLREYSTMPSSPPPPTYRCPKCGQCFAGSAVLVRHVESIHDKLLWNCFGCKSNLSRRDAVTRHINLSPMDSVCRSVGTIGQIKMLNGSEVHYEVSSYKAKPLDEVMSRMGKKIPMALRKEIEQAKVQSEDSNISGASLDSEQKYGVLDSLGEDDEDAAAEMEFEDVDSGEQDCDADGLSKKRKRSLVNDLSNRKK
ncbi:hypothetical protein BG011_001110 [Mortierella polycephala]|uniref:C2H2-type domain-containing protein n=1 Tax=Mortierella polycephala TaxID=41804 RepID=A0A9P6QA98_9FUNG|nr:hypothetical protein BG011_001110 [Mortierella polycephala]